MRMRGVNMIFQGEESNTKFYNLRGRIFKIKFCKTCMIIRPVGTTHCKICDICVERFDHHCPWVGNCIGRNNYKFFLIFILHFDLLLIFNFLLSVTQFNILNSCTSFIENEWRYTGINNFTKYNCTDHININLSMDMKGGINNPPKPMMNNLTLPNLPIHIFKIENIVWTRQYIALILFILSFLVTNNFFYYPHNFFRR
jgi:hypothetical protein